MELGAVDGAEMSCNNRVNQAASGLKPKKGEMESFVHIKISSARAKDTESRLGGSATDQIHHQPSGIDIVHIFKRKNT